MRSRMLGVVAGRRPLYLWPVFIMPRALLVVFCLLFCAIHGIIGKERVSKCMQNHMKAREYLDEEAALRRNEDDD